MKDLPKVELHLHLEGAAPPSFVRGLAAEKGHDLSGIFAEDGSNPIGEVPLIQIRRSPAEPGRWFSAEPQDLLDAQRALNHDFTDLGTISRLQGFAQGYIKGMNQEQVSDLRGLGPNTFVGLWEDAELGFASPTPDLKGYLGQVESYVRTVCLLYTSPSPRD